ncbi:hypothetical protein [Streptomyces sp. NPDC055107]
MRQADLDDETAALYEELTGAEPQLAEEHRYSAERARAHAAAEREYAEPLAPRAPPTSAAAAPGARPARHSRRRRGRASSRAGLAVGELAQRTEEGDGFGDLADGADGVAQGDSAEGCVLDQRGRWMWVWSMTLFRLMVQA